MEFKYALEALKNGKKVKCPEWIGYWVYENNNIMMYCKDGTIMKLTDTKDILYTLEFITRNDWEIVDNSYAFEHVSTMRFEEALRYLRIGKRIARKGWNGANQYVYLTKGSTVPFDSLKEETYAHYTLDEKRNIDHVNVNIKDHLDLKNAQDEIIIGWVPTQSDLLADDWYIVELVESEI